MAGAEPFSDPDVEMLDAPPLENSTSSHTARASLHPPDRNHTHTAQPSSLYSPEPTSETARSSRQLSGALASTSYLQPVHVGSLQRVTSTSQPAASQVIDLDDGSPLPLRHRRQANAFGSGALAEGALHTQHSGGLVDLTGESPPVDRLPVRHPSHRVKLESIGNGSLRRTSSDLGKQPNRSQRMQQQPAQGPAQHHTSSRTSSRNVRNSSGFSQNDRLAAHGTDHSGESGSGLSHQVGDFLDISGLQSSQLGRHNRQPAHSGNAARFNGFGNSLLPQR